jgi:integrase/recombinase XerD
LKGMVRDLHPLNDAGDYIEVGTVS